MDRVRKILRNDCDVIIGLDGYSSIDIAIAIVAEMNIISKCGIILKTTLLIRGSVKHL